MAGVCTCTHGSHPLACKHHCKFVLLLSTTSRMLLPQPLPFQTLALLPGVVGIPFCTPRHVATNTSRTEERVKMRPKGSALYENQRRDYFSALPAGSLAASFAADSFAAASLAAALACESR